jgi:uncharacterized protein (DUF934 family)
MTVLKNGEIVTDPIATSPLEEWLAAGNNRAGVQLSPDQPPECIAEHLDQIPVVAIEFPVFSDGRGFSYGRQLREQYGYQGEIRAVGHLIRDQYLFLQRCGFDAIGVSDNDDGGGTVSEWKLAMEEYSLFYQNTIDRRTPVAVLRQKSQNCDV